MKIELVVGVYEGENLFDTCSYTVPVEPMAHVLARIPDGLDDVCIKIEGLEVLFE